jgi:PAS domain S-box-containing protein
MDEIIKILIVEADDTGMQAIRKNLADNGAVYFEEKTAVLLSEAIDLLNVAPVDLIVLDLYLPDSTGSITLKSIRSTVPSVPVIALLESGDADSVKNACGEILIHYVLKESGYVDRLPRVIHHVVHELHQIELAKGNQRFRSYIDYAPDGIFIADHTGRFIDVNLAACEMSGYTRDELLQMHTVDFIAAESRNDAALHFTATVSTGKAVADLWFITKKGEKRCLTINAVKISDKELIGFCREITIRKQMELTIRENEARFRAIAEYSYNAIGILNDSGRFVWVNHRFVELLGYSYDEIMSTNTFRDRLTPDSAEYVIGNFRKILAGDPCESYFNFSFFNKDNRLCYADMYMTDYVDKMEKKNLVIHFTDITERKLVDEKVKMQLQELLRWQDVILEREERIIELKDEINRLCGQLGQLPRYSRIT